MIPEDAVEAAAEWLPHSDDCTVRPERDCTCWQPRVDLMRAALETAAPYMLSHEREETRLAHLDAVVNAATVDRLEKELAEAKAYGWDAYESAPYEIRLTEDGKNWEPFKVNPYRSQDAV